MSPNLFNVPVDDLAIVWPDGLSPSAQHNGHRMYSNGETDW